MQDMDREAIGAFLESHMTGYLGTLHGNKPYVVPVSYLYEDATIYFAAEPGQKVADIRQNPTVCFEVDEAIPESGRCRSVVTTGWAHVVEDEAVRRKILRALVARFEQQGPRGATQRHYPAHVMARYDGTSEMLVVAVPVEEVTGSEVRCC